MSAPGKVQIAQFVKSELRKKNGVIYDFESQTHFQVTGQPNSGYDRPESLFKEGPVFSPAGTQIVFINWVSGGKEIEVVTVDGSNRFVLVPATDEHRDVMHLDWGP